MMVKTSLTIIVCLCWLLACEGCDDPYIGERQRHYNEQFDFALSTIVDREVAAPALVEKDVRWMGEDLEWHRRATRRNMVGIEEWIRDDMNRWRNVQSGVVADEARHVIAGDPEHALRTLPMLFY